MNLQKNRQEKQVKTSDCQVCGNIMEHGQKRKQHENNNTKLLFEASSWFDNF